LLAKRLLVGLQTHNDAATFVNVKYLVKRNRFDIFETRDYGGKIIFGKKMPVVLQTHILTPGEWP